MDLIEVIKGCTTVEEIEALEWLFDFEDRHKEAALFQRIIILSSALERDLENERCGISTVLMDGWSDEQRESFKRDWNDDSFLAEMDDGGQAPEPAIPSLMDGWSNEQHESFRMDWNDDSFMAELEDISDVSGEPSIPEVSIQTGEGSRKRAAKPSTESIPSNDVLSPGHPIGQGLSAEASKDLDLPAGLPVATSLIDAYAGGLGIIGAAIDETNLPSGPITSRLAIISGTSSCHMAISEGPLFVEGVWGPYYSAMVPGLWVNEGGQSATGKLIDHVIESHPAWSELKENAQKHKCTVYEELTVILDKMASSQGLEHAALLTRDYHVYPDFHGNRSPIADPTLKGMIAGLSLSQDISSLAVLYLATIQALACGTKQILERLNSAGHDINAIFLCGGLSKNPVFVQSHADVTGLSIALPREADCVLVGSAILAAFASGDFQSIKDAMLSMSSVGQVFHPNCALERFYEGKYRVFEKMLQDQMEYRTIMNYK